MNNHYLQVEIATTIPLKTIKFLSSLNINLYEVKISSNKLILKITIEDYKRLKKLINCQKIKDYGLKEQIKKLFQNTIFLYIAMIFLFSVFICTNLTAKIIVIHSNPELRNLLTKELASYNIKSLSFKKNYQKIQTIKKEILHKYQEQLEWLEIFREGMNYVVKAQDRIITNIEPMPNYCDVIAKKDGIIKRIVPINGETISDLNKYVREGDTLITGKIIANEEMKTTTCAQGLIYAETWYQISISMPKEEIIKLYTDKKRYNLFIESNNFSWKIFRSRLDKFDTTNNLLLKIGDYKLYLQQEQEYEIKKENLTDKEIISKINEEINLKLKTKLKEDYKILSQKVLKKSINDSTIYMEVFVTVEEQIGMTKQMPLPEEKGDE